VNDLADPTRPKWGVISPDDIIWTGTGDDWIAYHRPSGKTHFLNAASRLLITDLLAEPAGLPELLEAFGIPAGRDDATSEVAVMRSLLDRLVDTGLIERL
jgi:PqqD family protein of HPr-rel-A system